MRHIRVLICQVDDGTPDLMNELACFDLATPAVARLQPETALDALEATTQETGHAILRRLLHAQWDQSDAALVARHCAQVAPAVVQHDGQETVTVASRFGLLHLSRQVCVDPRTQKHTRPGNAVLPPHGGMLITRGLQEWRGNGRRREGGGEWDTHCSRSLYDMGEALEQAQVWTRLPEDERKRQAMEAAQHHDGAALWRLTESWLITHGEQGAHVSPHTRAAYARGMRLLLGSWGHENLLRPGRMAGADWRTHLESRGLKTSSVRVYLAAARALYAALRSAGATAADPFKDTRVARDRVPRWEKRTPYSNDEVATLLTVATAPEERLLVLLEAHAGLRNSEMLALTWPDVHLAGGHLVVQAGKGGKKRTVPLSTTLRAALAACTQPTGYVLPIQERRAGIRHRMTLVQRMRALCQRADVPYRSVHALRHTAGTRLYAQTGKIEDAAAFLGHSQLETSRVYIHHADEGVKTAVTTW